eukprot:1219445-Amphidinium_carterae.1
MSWTPCRRSPSTARMRDGLSFAQLFSSTATSSVCQAMRITRREDTHTHARTRAHAPRALNMRLKN